MNGRSKQLRADRRRSEIRRDAMAAIRRLGLRRAGMREIADAAGLSAGNLYYYWKSKEALVADCQEATLDALLEVAARAQAEKGSEAQLAELVRGHLGVILSDDGGDVHLDFAGLPPALYRRVVQKRDRYERAVRSLVADGQKRGDLRGGDPKLAAFALLGALNWTARWYHSGGAYAVSDVIDHFVPQLLGGLLRHEPRQAAR